MLRDGEKEARTLVLAPTGRDARLIAETLESAGITALSAPNCLALADLLEEGAAAAVIAEEALTAAGVERIATWLKAQPPWSDMPLVVLTFAGRPSRSRLRRAMELDVLGNVTFLERPVRPETIRGAMRAALRARMRQYEMRHRQETLIRLNADLENFAYSASHDLQEPLRMVAIYSDLVAKRYGAVLDAQGQEFLNYLKSGAIRMQDLVKDILTYAEVTSGPDEPGEGADAACALRNVISNLKEAVNGGGGTITHDELPTLRMRPFHLEQLLQNLVGNAIKYRGEAPPRVHVRADRQGKYWVLSVQDNGIGIPPEFKEHIFGIFKRLHTNDTYPGTGVGLAICQRIVERYQGRIWVESEPGVGSIFFVTIPV